MKIAISVKWKVMGLILVLITIIIAILGFIVEKQQTEILLENIYSSAKREAQSIVYIDSRAIISNDDLVILDSLKNLNDLEGFVYARVINAETKSNLVQSYNSAINKGVHKKLDKLWDKVIKPIFGKVSYTQKDKVWLDKIKHPEQKGSNLLLFHIGIYHPFSLKNQELLGFVQIVFSDQFVQAKIKKNRINLLILGAIFWVVGIIASLLLGLLIVRPIRILSQGAKIVGSGNLEYQLPSLGGDEIGQLAVQFNAMTAGLKVAQSEKANSLIFEEQLRQAQVIQEGMNPLHFLKREKFQIKGYTRAAKGVGGDYFDFHILGDGKIALLISDVSGKSLSASLVMVIIKTVVSTYLKLFKNHLRSDLITQTINRVMCGEAHIDKFATFLFALYDPSTGVVEFTNGGHGPLFIYRHKDKICTLTKLAGLPMGIDADNEYSLAKTNLEKGDMLIFYTDGVSEAWDTVKNEYGNVRLSQDIIRLADQNVDVIVKDIVKNLDEFMDGAEQHDDMTLLLMKIT